MSVQLTCPYCKKEFPYDNGKLDADISNIGQRINQINCRLNEIKFGKHDDETFKERRKLIIERGLLIKKITELKAVRKVGDQQKNLVEYQIFKDVVRDFVGEEAFLRLCDKRNEEMKAYKISGLMWTEYSRANYKKNVTNINKL